MDNNFIYNADKQGELANDHLIRDGGIGIQRSVAKSKYQRNYQMDHIQTNNPNLSNTDVYLNMTIHNFNTNDRIVAAYTEDRKKALLKNASDYKMSVVRFDAPSQEIPMFFWRDNYYSITIRVVDSANTVYEVQEYLKFVPREIPAETGDNRAVYTVDQMIESIRQAINDICDQLPATCPIRLNQNFRPNLSFNPSTSLFDWIIKQDVSGGAPWANLTFENTIDPTTQATSLATVSNATAQLFVNRKLDFLFENIPKKEFQPSSTTFQTNNKETLYNVIPGGYNIQDIAGTDYYILRQTFSTINLWYELYKIVIISNMEIRKEFIGVSTGDTNSNQIEPSSLLARGILTDFDVEYNRATASRITYQPTAEYRFIDILKDGDLTFLDFQVFYQTVDGLLRPVLLEPNQSANIKILFRQK
jgi:hypothetical protein